MADNLNELVQEFKDRFESGETKVEYITNNGSDYALKERRDLDAFKKYLDSEACELLASEVLGNGSSSSS